MLDSLHIFKNIRVSACMRRFPPVYPNSFENDRASYHARVRRRTGMLCQ